jgi:signal transduction histidine kinase
MLSRAFDPVVRAIGRVPASLNTKLLVTFVGTVVLLVVLGILGLRVIGESNDRVEALGALQLRATQYRELQTKVEQLRTLLGLRAGGPDVDVYVGGTPSSNSSIGSLVSIDAAITASLSPLTGRVDAQGQSGRGAGRAIDPARLGFTPPPDEQRTLDQIQLDFDRLSLVMTEISRNDRLGNSSAGLQLQTAQAEPIGEELRALTANLVGSTDQLTQALIVQNRTSFADSQRLFIAVAAISILVALLLGYLLSRSLVGPIRQMESRLSAIESGDFSGHVDVPNRDELGVLASEINQMNDELGRLYKELEAASRHKSEFLANMSHELRTPLNAIIGFSQVLKEQMFGDLNSKQAEYLDDILSSGQHLLNLINDILDLAKVEAGRMELQVSTFALAATLENATVMVRERAVRQGVALETEIDPSVGWLDGDERKVKQILFNLLSNAVKFTPAGGRVTLRARAHGEMVTIAVRDTGVGIGSNEQARIFDEFYQVGPSANQEGTGLGLALTRRLVELHGGQLRVASAPGEGSTFTVSLPLHPAATAVEKPFATAEEPVSL